MLTITELCDRLLYVESDRWQCSFGHGEPVRLGLVLEAVNLGGGEEDEYSFVIDASLIPQPEYLDGEIMEEARAEGAADRDEQIRYAYECYGGVPVNIDAVQPAKASCGFSSFVAESSIRSIKAGSGEEMEVRHFRDREEAMRFARDFYAVYASVLFGFIDGKTYKYSTAYILEPPSSWHGPGGVPRAGRFCLPAFRRDFGELVRRGEEAR